MNNIYRTAARFIPHGTREKLAGFLKYSSVKDHDVFIGFVTVISIVAGIVLAVLSLIFFGRFFILILVGVPVLVNGITYVIVLFSVDKKARFVEASLPDALQLMSSNLHLF